MQGLSSVAMYGEFDHNHRQPPSSSSRVFWPWQAWLGCEAAASSARVLLKMPILVQGLSIADTRKSAKLGVRRHSSAPRRR